MPVFASSRRKKTWDGMATMSEMTPLRLLGVGRCVAGSQAPPGLRVPDVRPGMAETNGPPKRFKHAQASQQAWTLDDEP